VLCQHARHHFINGADDLEQGVIWKVLEGKLALALIAGVRLAKHGMSIARDHLACLERLPGKVRDGLLGDLIVGKRETGSERARERERERERKREKKEREKVR